LSFTGLALVLAVLLSLALVGAGVFLRQLAMKVV